MSVLVENPGQGPGAGAADAGGGTVCTREQLARLFRLVLLLQSERFPNARELAERCEVSRRTIYRDLESLERAGVPVRYRQEQEGYQLAKGFFLSPTGVEEVEALALLVMARQWGQGDGLGLLPHAWAGAVKLVQALPQEVRERVLAAAAPVSGGSAPQRGSDRRAVHDTIRGSLAQLRQVRVWYRDSETGEELCTKFSLYRLLRHENRWYMVGRSTLHRRVIVVGVPWVRKVVQTDDPYEVPPRFRLDRFLGQAWGVNRGSVRSRVALRFSPRVSPELNDSLPHPALKRVEHADGSVELHFVVDGFDEILRWILGFGAEVEVLDPSELREALFRVAADLARRHRPSRRRHRP